jgi:hypothetical protein
MISLELSKQIPIEVHDHNKHQWRNIPDRQVLENIPVIWIMLEQVIQDWTTASRVYPSFANVKEKAKRAVLEFEAFQRFKPRLFQCLFSYIIFFFMLENGYHFVYSELNRINRELGLRTRHNKPPERTEFINSLWKLRNFSVAHWAGTEKNISDSVAGRQWGYAFGHTKRHEEWAGDMEHLVPLFSGMVIASIPDTHARCSNYLSEFDIVCSDYLKAIIEQMPKTLNGVEYNSYRWTDSGLVSTRNHSHNREK